jgi:hypothetical protein
VLRSLANEGGMLYDILLGLGYVYVNQGRQRVPKICIDQHCEQLAVPFAECASATHCVSFL